jgi:hypothetical protein
MTAQHARSHGESVARRLDSPQTKAAGVYDSESSGALRCCTVWHRP